MEKVNNQKQLKLFNKCFVDSQNVKRTNLLNENTKKIKSEIWQETLSAHSLIETIIIELPEQELEKIRLHLENLVYHVANIKVLAE